MRFFPLSPHAVTAAALFCFVLVPPSAKAGLFDTLLGGGATCEVSDRACIIGLHTQAIIDRAQEQGTDPTYAGAEFARQSVNWSQDERDAAMIRFEEAGLDQAFFEAYSEADRMARAREMLNVDGIAASINGEGWPEAMKWRDFIQKAVGETLFTSDDAGALFDLWRENQAFFEEFAEKESVQIMQWGLLNRPQETLTYLFSEAADHTVVKRGLGAFVDTIAQVCSNGDRDAGARLIEGFEYFASTQTYEGNSAFLPLKNRFMIALHCSDRSEVDAAFDALEKVVNQTLETQQPSFETGWVYSGLKDASEAYALTLWEEGDQAGALEILKRGASRAMRLGSVLEGGQYIDVTVWAVDVEGKWPDHKNKIAAVVQAAMEDLIGIQSTQAVYSPDPEKRFDFFANSFDPTFEICCVDGQHLEEMIDTLEVAAADRDVSAAAAKAVALMERHQTKRGKPFEARAVSELRLARIEKARGCVHSEDTQAQWLQHVSEQEYPGRRAAGLAAFLDYMQGAQKGDRQDCLFE